MPLLMNENEQVFGLKEAAGMTLLNKITKQKQGPWMESELRSVKST